MSKFGGAARSSPMKSWIVASLAALNMSACSAMSPPVTGTEVAGFSARLASDMAVPGEPLTRSLTAEEAVARAIRHNHSIRAKELEEALAHAKARALGAAMLPKIVAESDYYRRDRPQASRSAGSSTYSTSSDLATLSKDITLSLNLLDFGLSYIRARQGVDRAHQQHEETRRIAGRIAEDTRVVFWRSVAQEKLTAGLTAIDREVDASVALSQQSLADPRLEPSTSMNFLKEILNLQRELNQLQVSIAGAKDQLVQLTGLQSVKRVRLSAAGMSLRTVAPKRSPQEDVTTALQQRPEIRQHMYDLRITADEVDATIIQLLPGVSFSKSYASDSNSHLLHGHWIGWGTKVVGNLMNLARLDTDLEVVDRQERTHRQSALSTAATIAMQIHLARARIAVQQRALRDAARFAIVQRNLRRHVEAAVAAGRTGHQALTREKLATLLAEVRAVMAFADLQAALAAYATARGDDLIARDDRSVAPSDAARMPSPLRTSEVAR